MAVLCTQTTPLSITPDLRWKMLRSRAFASASSTRTPSSGCLNTDELVSPGVFPFNSSNAALGKDGQYRWFLIHYNPFRDERGRVVRWYATGTDINERKINEERTQNENVALREDFDQLPDV